MAAFVATFLIASFDGEMGKGHGLGLGTGLVVGPTGHGVESLPPWTMAKRAPSDAAFERLLVAQMTRPKSTIPKSSTRKTGMMMANSTSA